MNKWSVNDKCMIDDNGEQKYGMNDIRIWMKW